MGSGSLISYGNESVMDLKLRKQSKLLNGYSSSSCQDTVSLFISMFPDSKIAEKMELGPDKLKF